MEPEYSDFTENGYPIVDIHTQVQGLQLEFLESTTRHIELW